MRNLPDSGFGSVRGGMNGIGSLVRSFSMFGMNLNRIAQQEKKRVHRAYQESSVGAPITEAATNARAEARRQSRWITDPALKKAVNNLTIDFNKAAKSADSLQKQERARVVLIQGLRQAERTATSAIDRTAIRDLRNDLSASLSSAFTTARAQKALGRDPTSGFKGFLGKLPSIVKGFQAGWTAFQHVNHFVNNMARSAMMVSRERGHYGRQIRGAGLNFSDMMSAIGTGRRSGMDDAEVIQKMVGMQTQLAQARWGEGPMINNMGRWGLTPFTSEGKMKSPKEIMMDLSDKLNSISDETEKLQFLTHQGFAPEQMEFVANYARDARRWENIKKNPERMGVLESARILDESGLAAKIDDATNIELRRRQILNQNAIDEGILPGMIRQLHPENWFFNDWTARQKGVESAKSELAMRKLTDELVNVRKTIKDNNGIVTLDTDSLKGLALTGGWAQADIENKGENSGVHILRALYEKRLGTKSLAEVEAKNKDVSGALLGAGGAAAGAATGALIGSVIPLLGTAAGAIIGGLIGMFSGVRIGTENPFTDFDDGSMKHIKALRALKGNGEAITKYANEHGLEGLSPEVIESAAFQDDAEAKKILQGAFVTGRYMNAQSLTDKTVDPLLGMEFKSDPIYRAVERAKKARGELVNDYDTEKAIARAGTGDATLGMDLIDLNDYIKYGYDKNSKENQVDIAQRIGKLRKQYKQEGKEKSYEELKAEAEAENKAEWQKTITPDMLQAAIENTHEGTRESIRFKAEQKYRDITKAYNKVKEEGVFFKDGEIEKFTTQDGALETEKAQLEAELKTSKDAGRKEYVRNRLERLNKIQAYKELGGASEEEYAEKAVNDMQDIEGLQKQLFPDGNVPFAFQTKEQQAATFKAFQNGAGQGKSLAEQIAAFSIEQGVDSDKVRENLGVGKKREDMTAEERMEFDKTQAGEQAITKQDDDAKELARLKKLSVSGVVMTEAEKNRLAELAGNASLAGVSVDETETNAATIAQIAARGGDINKVFSADEVEQYQKNEASRKQAFLDSGKSEAEWNVFKGYENQVLRGEEVPENVKNYVAQTQEELAIATPEEVDDLWVDEEEPPEAAAYSGESDEQLAARMKDEEKKPSMALQSDLRQIDNMVRNGFSEKDIQQHFGEDRLNAYRDAVNEGIFEDYAKMSKEERKAKAMDKRSEQLKAAGIKEDSELYREKMGEAEDDWDAAEKKREEKKAAAEAKQKQYDREHGIIETGYPTDETDVPLGHTLRSDIVAATEEAAASGNAAMGAAGVGKEITTNMQVEEGAVQVVINANNVDSEDVKNGVGDDAARKFASIACSALNENTKGLGVC